MSATNTRRPKAAPVSTMAGGAAHRNSAEEQLKRFVTTALLWESNFYESGDDAANRIGSLVKVADPEYVANLASYARQELNLRHAPLLLVRELARGTPAQKLAARKALPFIVRRPDELTEFVAIYWKTNGGKKTLPACVKKGLAEAFNNFGIKDFSHWDKKDSEVRLRDVMFLVHPKPTDRETPLPRHDAGWRKQRKEANVVRELTAREQETRLLAQDELPPSGKWEERLNAGEEKGAVFSELMAEGKLSALAFIRNMRNMEQAGIKGTDIEAYAHKVRVRGLFPHQILTAAKVNPGMVPALDVVMKRVMDETSAEFKLKGRTAVLVDVSGSMASQLSQGMSKAKNAMPTARMEAGAGLALAFLAACEQADIYSFSDRLVRVPSHKNIALINAIVNSQPNSSTHLVEAVRQVQSMPQRYERIVVITDEQATDAGRANLLPNVKGYMMNVAPYAHGVARTGDWEDISGWSPTLVRYVQAIEAETEGEGK